MFATERNGATHTHMQEGKSRDDEKASLPKGHCEPEPDGGGRVAANGVPGRTTEELSHCLPYEDGQC